MNDFIKLATFRKVFKSKRLINCFILITLVTIPLVCALSLSESMMNGIENKFIYLTGGHILTEGFCNTSKIDDKVEEVQNVCISNCLLYANENYLPLQIKGVQKDYFSEKRSDFCGLDNEISLEGNSILISRETARQCNLKEGDKVAVILISNDNKSSRASVFSVKGFFNSGYREIDSSNAYCSFDYLFPLTDNCSYTEIVVSPKFEDRLYELENSLDNYCLDWMDRNSSVYANFVNSRQLIMIILLVVGAMAAFFTASVAQQFVQDNIEELSLYKLLGSSNSLITKLGFTCVFSTTFAAVCFGLGLGCIITYCFEPLLSHLNSLSLDSLSYYLLDFSIFIPIGRVIVLLVIMLIISAFSIVFSLRKTRRITPLQLFNYKW